MKVPAKPANESQRVERLQRLAVLDTPAEERFDRFTRLAQRLFGVPIALVSLVDSDRQWFKSRQGLEAEQTPRDVSFCGHVILEDAIFVVPDACADPRFSDNPLVTGEPNVRFYAGYPLEAPDGSKVGTLCIIDHVPRQLTDGDRQLLADLGGMVQAELAAIELATTDPLTGLSNRRGFELIAHKVTAVCNRADTSAVLLFFDLDGFKQINDRFGHAEGDRALAAFARLLLRNFRSSDVVARLGGDEFCVLLTGIDPDAKLETVMLRFARRVEAHNAANAGSWALAYSCGAVTYAPGRHLSVAELLAEADRRMYEQKRGRPRANRRA